MTVPNSPDCPSPSQTPLWCPVCLLLPLFYNSEREKKALGWQHRAAVGRSGVEEVLCKFLVAWIIWYLSWLLHYWMYFSEILSAPALCVLGALSRSLLQLCVLCSRPTLFHQNTHSRRKLGAHQVSECRSGAHTLSQREKESRRERERERESGVSPRPAKRPLLEHKSRGPGREIWGI